MGNRNEIPHIPKIESDWPNLQNECCFIWIGVVPVAIVGYRVASVGGMYAWSFTSSLLPVGLNSGSALQKFVVVPLLWGSIAAVSTWAAVAMAPGHKRSVAAFVTLRIAHTQMYSLAILFSIGNADFPGSPQLFWQSVLHGLANIFGAGIVAWGTCSRPRFIGLGIHVPELLGPDTLGPSSNRLTAKFNAPSAKFIHFAKISSALAVAIVLAGIAINSVWRTNRDEPSFTLTLPDSQHQTADIGPRANSGAWAARISVVRPNVAQTHGLAPPGTSSAWSRWLVIKVLESLDSTTPRYYFVDLNQKQTVGPWSPGENVYLETFDPDGRFVAFARDSFMSHHSITHRIHHFDPATNTASKFDRPANESWQECFSVDGRTMAAAIGGSESALQIEIIQVRDGSIRQIFDFAERRSMPADDSGRDRLGRRWGLSPDGKFLAMSGDWVESAESNVIEIWNTTSGELDHRFDESTTIGELDASVSAVRFSPDAKELIVELWTEPRNREFRRLDLKTKKLLEGFNPWEGLTSNKFGNYGYSNGVVGMDGKHVLWWRRPKLQDNQHTAAWEISVTDINGSRLRDWKQLPDRVARRLDDRLDARIVPGSDRIAIMNPYGDSISWYDWQTDELRRFATTHKRHNGVDHYATQPGWISVLYREKNLDITVKLWSMPASRDL
jgi:hypothetical protein